MTAPGFFSNGHQWTGEKEQDENGIYWFNALDENNLEYQTREIPDTPPLFTLTQFVGVWTEKDVKQYYAKKLL